MEKQKYTQVLFKHKELNESIKDYPELNSQLEL